jgi:hypothetical protein
MTNTFTPTTTTNKFQRTYQLQIQPWNAANSIQVIGSLDGSQPLLTLEFNIVRNNYSAVNTGNFRIRNLNQATRNIIFKDYFNQGQWTSVVLKAGYVGTPLSTIFNGMAHTICSYREEGGTDWITEIDATDFSGLFSNSFSSWTKNPPSGQTQKDVIQALAKDLQASAEEYGQTLGIGSVGGFTAPRYSYTANDFTMNILAVETSRQVAIDNGKLYAMPYNYAFDGDVTLISSATGLLGTPRLQQTFLVASMIFEPAIVPWQYVELQTEDTNFTSANNGPYKVLGVQHAGIISSTKPGKCTTNVSMQYLPNRQQAPLGFF